MNTFSKIIIFIVICAAGWWAYDSFLADKIKLPDFSTEKETEILLPNKNNEENQKPADEPKEPINREKEQSIYVYMLTTDKAGTQFLKPVARPLPPGKDKLSYAVRQLFVGPNHNETAKGIYSEIPESAKLIAVTDSELKVIVDVTGSFSYGGGSDSIYSRVRQLIKTVLANTDKPVYLYIDGKQADVIGGEGISLTQPLSEKSLDE